MAPDDAEPGAQAGCHRGPQKRRGGYFTAMNQNLQGEALRTPSRHLSPSFYLHCKKFPFLQEVCSALSLLPGAFFSPPPAPEGTGVTLYAELRAGRVTILSGFLLTQIISYVSHLRRLDSIAHSIFLRRCYVLVPEPVITINQVDFRPNCPGK